MCLSIIPGFVLESPSGFGQVGIRIQDCSSTALESRLGSAFESAILAGSAGAGTIGGLTGITTMSFITITLTFRTAESSLITTPSIARARTAIMLADFMVEADFRAAAPEEIRGSMDQPRNMDSRRHMFNLAAIPARSAALIMEELPGDSLLAGSRVSVAGSTVEAVEAFTVAEVMEAVAAGNSVHS